MGYPGSPAHQTVLRAIDEHFREDDRILSFIVFGSIGRGDWHPLSDLDLDVIVADHVEVKPYEEAEQLAPALASIGEEMLIVVPDGGDAIDVVLSSLMGMSIRYHHLATTKSAIVDSMLIISGALDAETIRAAAGQSSIVRESHEIVLNRCLRYLIETSHDVQRQRLWSALEGLHRARGLIMAMFAQHAGGTRSLQTFQAHADSEFQFRLAQSVPRATFSSVMAALVVLLDLIESEANDPANEWIMVTESQRELLRLVKAHVINQDGA